MESDLQKNSHSGEIMPIRHLNEPVAGAEETTFSAGCKAGRSGKMSERNCKAKTPHRFWFVCLLFFMNPLLPAIKCCYI